MLHMVRLDAGQGPLCRTTTLNLKLGDETLGIDPNIPDWHTLAPGLVKTSCHLGDLGHDLQVASLEHVTEDLDHPPELAYPEIGSRSGPAFP